jgi:hypothetical protein
MAAGDMVLIINVDNNQQNPAIFSETPGRPTGEMTYLPQDRIWHLAPGI